MEGDPPSWQGSAAVQAKNGTWEGCFKAEMEMFMWAILLEPELLEEFKASPLPFVGGSIKWENFHINSCQSKTASGRIHWFSLLQRAECLDYWNEIPHYESPKGTWDFLFEKRSLSQLWQRRKWMLQRTGRAFQLSVPWWMCQPLAVAFGDVVALLPLSRLITRSTDASLCLKRPFKRYCP